MELDSTLVLVDKRVLRPRESVKEIRKKSKISAEILCIGLSH
jgi:hypothetical protein